MNKIALIFGTRPEIIKLSPLMRLLRSRRTPHFLVHTGQHYSYKMDQLFFKEMELPRPQYHLSARSVHAEGHGGHTGRMMEELEQILLKERPTVVLVQGDTNSVLAGSLAASKISGIQLGHVEAGLRSYDREMPEEINRIVSDHLADLLFVPTETSKKTLLGEGISKKQVFITGNTIVDAIFQNLHIAKKKARLYKSLGLSEQDFFLTTLHRPENVDDRRRFKSILSGLDLVANRFKKRIMFSVHPRTLKNLRRFGLSLPKGVQAVSPMGFLDFLKLEETAGLILTDSGGVQEEACILKTPCVTLRTTTERPETIQVKANRIAGHDPDEILKSSAIMMNQKRSWRNPFGDGHASERILRICREIK